MKIYNSLKRKKEEFIPIDKENIKIYSCGPTVYNFFHIGNARPFIMFDVLRSYLEYRGYNVTFVQNFTDIDDKMIAKANEMGITVKELGDMFIKEYYTDAKGLNIKDATLHPRATENIDAIIEIIETLIEKDYAYEVKGDVYFRVKNYKDYGSLSKMPIEDLEEGASKRTSDTDIKENPLDFALWKNAKEGEVSFDSPFGKGRPGWHIECSAMINKFLGETIDIHCGGKDLIFPHHENEVAQSTCANGKILANYFMHNGFINIDNEKMSKSKGNFFTVRDLADKYSYESVRFFMLSSHYRSPINYSVDIIESTNSGLERLYSCKDNIEYIIKSSQIEKNKDDDNKIASLEIYKEKFINAMDDDLNTADGVSVIFELVKEINILLSEKENPSKFLAEKCLDIFSELTGVLRIVQNKDDDILDDEIEKLIEERQEARKNKDFKKSDCIRDMLLSKGIELLDTRQGVKWKKIK